MNNINFKTEIKTFRVKALRQKADQVMVKYYSKNKVNLNIFKITYDALSAGENTISEKFIFYLLNEKNDFDNETKSNLIHSKINELAEKFLCENKDELDKLPKAYKKDSKVLNNFIYECILSGFIISCEVIAKLLAEQENEDNTLGGKAI